MVTRLAGMLAAAAVLMITLSDGRVVASTVAPMPTESYDDARQLLDSLARRLLDARGGLGRRFTGAARVARGRAVKFSVIDVAPPAAIRRDRKLRAALIADMGNGPRLYVNVVDYAAAAWLVGAPAKATPQVTLVWPSPAEHTSEDLAPPLAGTEGLLFVPRARSRPLVVEQALRAALPGSQPVDVEVRPILVPDVDGGAAAALTAVAALSPTERGAQAVALVDASRGAGIQVTLAALVTAGAASRAGLRQWLAGPARDAATALLVRAALWRLGDRAVATAGVDLTTIPAAAMERLGLQTIDGGDARALAGPSNDTPLPW